MDQVTIQSWRAPGAHPEPSPSFEFSKRKWAQEHQIGFDSQTSLWDMGMREGFPNCTNHNAATDAAGDVH